MTTIKDKLIEVLDFLDYAHSELDTATNELPDYSANESSRTYMSQTESYLTDAKDILADAVNVLVGDRY